MSIFNSKTEFLFLFGWNDFFENQISNRVLNLDSLMPARVICEERNLYRLQSDFDDTFWATVSGKMQFNASSRADFPAVGDWVMVERTPAYDRGVIHQVLQRKNIIYRKQIGPSADMQILSTNVDYAFITTSVNSDLNYRRLERYLTIATDAAITPVILLTKADICTENIEDIVADIKKEFPGVAVHPVSKNNFANGEFTKTDCQEIFQENSLVNFWSKYLKKGTTSIFIGSSGVGKSTLINFLIEKDFNNESIKTQSIRESDGKGRHTTTSRHLYVSQYGGLIIDTPGMRELQLSDHTDGISHQFAEIENLILQCRFSDCQHQTEPDCAVKDALTNGSLSADKWQSYQKLESEVRRSLRKQDKLLAAEDRKMWKKRSQEARNKGRLKNVISRRHIFNKN